MRTLQDGRNRSPVIVELDGVLLTARNVERHVNVLTVFAKKTSRFS